MSNPKAIDDTRAKKCYYYCNNYWGSASIYVETKIYRLVKGKANYEI